ncbi:MAG: 2-C-methyl-D-erythritol 4-phosphate cytidylyltransferase, partial [Verrucomicrobiota bacterium]
MPAQNNTAILLAAGSGSRMQGTVEDKILTRLAGLPLINHSISAFVKSGVINQFTIVYRDIEQRKALEAIVIQIELKDIPVKWIHGGSERQNSVYNALITQPENCEYVFIHDGARPLITATAIQDLHRAVLNGGAASLAHPVADTVKRIADPKQLFQTELEDLDRDRLWAMETPQAFAFNKILSAYENVRSK